MRRSSISPAAALVLLLAGSGSAAVLGAHEARPVVTEQRAGPAAPSAAWIDRAVVYGIAPALLGPHGLQQVTAALPRIAALGVNTLWLTPITAAAAGDFGYAVTDEFRMNPRLGTAGDLRALVTAAHARHMKVILDLVANHLSDQSAAFKDAVRRGRASPYYDYFVRDGSGAPQHYFDWQNLENLNYGDPDVQRMIIRASTRWVRDFDVDGFRVDAAWGPRRRTPGFWPRWSRALKRVKPDILLLAEAPADDPYYEASGFAAAYDWTDKLGDWAWRRPFDDGGRTAADLRAVLSQTSHDPGRRFRFLDNNDTGARFITRYGLAKTRVAAAMLLTLPGLPELFMGDEVGAAFNPYQAARPIDWQDRFGLRRWYQQLIALREQTAALRSHHLQVLDLPGNDQVLAYLRAAPEGLPVLVLLNYGPAATQVRLPATVRDQLGAKISDLMSHKVLAADDATAIPLAGYGVRILSASGARS